MEESGFYPLKNDRIKELKIASIFSRKIRHLPRNETIRHKSARGSAVDRAVIKIIHIKMDHYLKRSS